MLAGESLQEALRELPLIRETGPWSRAVGYHLLQGPPPGAPKESPPQPLWPGGPIRDGGRFTPKGSFGSIYLGSDAVTALKEVESIFSGAGTLRTPPWTVFAVEGSLEHVLDLTDPEILDKLETTVSELTGDWRYSQSLFLNAEAPRPPTQSLGLAAYDAETIVGLKYHSAKNTGAGTVWVVFSDRLVPNGASFLKVYDPHGLIAQEIP